MLTMTESEIAVDVAQSFVGKLTAAVERNDSLLCVGLDPSPDRFPNHFPNNITTEALFQWGQKIIEQTADLVCCYKPNIAFYEQMGPAGIAALKQTIAAVPDGIPVLLDAKRGDIGSTADAYAKAVFEVLEADAVTLNPYLGEDNISSFLAYPGKTAFVLAYTSNPSASVIQEFSSDETPLFEHVIETSQGWGDPTQIAYVVGATQPHAMARCRQLAPQAWILAPGIGAQSGDLAAVLNAGLDEEGRGVIVSASRNVLYADNPRAVAQTLRNQINQVRRAVKTKRQSSIPYRELILSLHEVGCIQFGDFTLSSGKQSPIYIDLRRISAKASLLRLAARAYADQLRGLDFDHLAAVPYAAMTIGTATALLTNSSLIYPRKEAKAYGTGKTVEGVFAAGERAVIIEDLVTSGGSVLKATASLEEAGLRVTDVVVLIDRQQGGAKTLAGQGYQLHATLTLPQILDTLQEAGRISEEEASKVRQYLSQGD